MKEDRGSVTAELAVVLPSVIGIFLVLLQVLSMQVERVQLAQAAGVAARASSHLVAYIEVQNLVSRIAPGLTLEIEQDAELTCATVSKQGLFKLQETICTRSQGM